jgi:hypothetical protein
MYYLLNSSFIKQLYISLVDITANINVVRPEFERNIIVI